jgi:hypothetical protein
MAAFPFLDPDRLRLNRYARACRGHPRLEAYANTKTWMAGTSPAMTKKHFNVNQSCSSGEI